MLQRKRQTKKMRKSVRYSHFKPVWASCPINRTHCCYLVKLQPLPRVVKTGECDDYCIISKKSTFSRTIVVLLCFAKRNWFESLISEQFCTIVNYSLLPSCTGNLVCGNNSKVVQTLSRSFQSFERRVQQFPKSWKLFFSNNFQSPGNFCPLFPKSCLQNNTSTW